MSKIDRGYTLEQAITAFVRPEDCKGFEKFLGEWETREKKTKIASRQIENEFRRKIGEANFQAGNFDGGNDPVEVMHLKEERNAKCKALWGVLLKDFGYQIPMRGAPAYSSRNPITHGLIEALRNGTAVALGLYSGLQNPTKIETKVWDAEWEFQTQATMARGGVPYIEIYDITIFLSGHISQMEREARRATRPLATALHSDLFSFLKRLGPCNEMEAWKQAEEHLGLKITRETIRTQRNRAGIKGISGRPQKSR
jgi:hypothetical protein